LRLIATSYNRQKHGRTYISRCAMLCGAVSYVLTSINLFWRPGSCFRSIIAVQCPSSTWITKYRALLLPRILPSSFLTTLIRVLLIESHCNEITWYVRSKDGC